LVVIWAGDEIERRYLVVTKVAAHLNNNAKFSYVDSSSGKDISVAYIAGK
jgi:hypothetical protein